VKDVSKFNGQMMTTWGPNLSTRTPQMGADTYNKKIEADPIHEMSNSLIP
jgi:hypothetical protein